VSTPPEAPAHTGDDEAGDEGQEQEAGDVVPVRHEAATDGVRGKKMTEQASAEK